jgi:hypothetical protein
MVHALVAARVRLITATARAAERAHTALHAALCLGAAGVCGGARHRLGGVDARPSGPPGSGDRDARPRCAMAGWT